MKHSIKTTIVAIVATTILVASTTPQVAHTLSIAGTADLQGTMEPVDQKFDLNYDGKKEIIKMGGIDRIATIYKDLKAQNPNTLTVTTGDDLMNKFFHTYKGKAIMSLISDAG
jgi:5'-nucleotidase